jgi:translation initiation factor 1 (eIF-1/SUI1)
MTSYLENHVVLQILNFIHPHLYRLVSRELTLLGGNQPGNVLPVSLLISLGSIETLESYKIVLLGYKFNYQSFASVVVSLGNFKTIQWFSSNGWNNIPFDESLLPIIARRGDAELFMEFLEFYHEEDCFEENEEHLQESLAEAAKFGQINILQKATSKNVSLVNEEISRKEFDLEELSQELLASAAIGGQVNVLEWIWINLSGKNEFMFEWDEWIWELVRDVVEANHIQSLE